MLNLNQNENEFEVEASRGMVPGYENAPATKLVATDCACCGRPLVDAKSVEAGIGPDCRKRHGFDLDVSDEARVEANKLVHDIAVEQGGFEVMKKVARLRELGFNTLADRIVKRLDPIKIDQDPDGRLVVVTPYSETIVSLFRNIAGRRWDRDRKVNTFPQSSKSAIWAAIQAAFPGRIGIGPKGAFQVPDLVANN